MTMHPDDFVLNNYVDGDLNPSERLAVETHLGECDVCRNTVDELRDLTRAAAALQHTAIEPGRDVWPSILRAIATRPAFRPSAFGWGAGLAAAASLLLAAAAGFGGGFVVGRQEAQPARPDAQLAALQQEVHDMRQTVTLSLLQQQSASERLSGVMYTDRLDKPGAEIIAALLDTLMHDPNVNVRLATVDALKRFNADPQVRHGATEALARQSSPMVQIALIDFLVDASARESTDALRRLAQDPQVDEAVRTRATAGLQRIG
jgi:anti-sigma factor ChrR (cupin superfamily)